MEIIPELNFSSSTIPWGGAERWQKEENYFLILILIKSWLGTLLIKTLVQIAYNLIGL